MLNELERSNDKYEKVLYGLCASSDGQCLIAADYQNGAAKRIDIISKQVTTIFLGEVGNYMFDIVCIRNNNTVWQKIAALLESEENPRINKVLIVENIENRRDVITLDETTEYVSGGSLLERRSGELLAKANKMLNILALKQGEKSARVLRIPDENKFTTGMALMENLLEREELLALVFLYGKAIGIFSLEENGLGKVDHINLQFYPYEILCIASKQTLLVSNHDGNKGALCVLRLKRDRFTINQILLGYKEQINILSWTAFRDKSGPDQRLALFDDDTRNLLLFELIWECPIEFSISSKSTFVI